MCGIAGLMTTDENIVRRALPSMVVALRQRGPDDAGDAYARLGELSLGLGHTRLSILDLSPAGHQPMVHPQTGDLYLRILRGLEGLDYDEFEDIVHSIAKTADAWDDRLKSS